METVEEKARRVFGSHHGTLTEIMLYHYFTEDEVNQLKAGGIVNTSPGSKPRWELSKNHS